MQHRCRDLESNRPFVPQHRKDTHGDDRFSDCANESCDTCQPEDFVEESVGGGVHSVENYRDVGQKFSDDVEGTYREGCYYWLSLLTSQGFGMLTPNKAQSELDSCVFFSDIIYTYGNGGLADYYCPNVMAHTDG